MRFRVIAGAATVGFLLGFGPLVADAPAAASPAPVTLGAAAGFAVLGGSTVTSAGVSTLNGDLGVSPGTAVTGFPPGLLNGTLHAGDAAATQAHADLATAYADAAGRSPATPITADLGGLTLTPGVYGAGAALTLAGTLTLDGQGDPHAVFILQAGSTLGTAAGSKVNLIGGAQACNVFWQVGSSATLGASSALAGTILASTSISMGDGVTIDGRALARDGAVTLINDTIATTQCAGSLASTAPAITPFSVKLTGLTQTVHTELGAWSVTDATATNAGYSVTVSATAPTRQRQHGRCRHRSDHHADPDHSQRRARQPSQHRTDSQLTANANRRAHDHRERPSRQRPRRMGLPRRSSRSRDRKRRDRDPRRRQKRGIPQHPHLYHRAPGPIASQASYHHRSFAGAARPPRLADH